VTPCAFSSGNNPHPVDAAFPIEKYRSRPARKAGRGSEYLPMKRRTNRGEPAASRSTSQLRNAIVDWIGDQ
jgi:hypothetical protein